MSEAREVHLGIILFMHEGEELRMVAHAARGGELAEVGDCHSTPPSQHLRTQMLLQHLVGGALQRFSQSRGHLMAYDVNAHAQLHLYKTVPPQLMYPGAPSNNWQEVDCVIHHTLHWVTIDSGGVLQMKGTCVIALWLSCFDFLHC